MANPRKKTTKKSPSKKALGKKAPRMSASAARAEGAAKQKRMRGAIKEIDTRILTQANPKLHDGEAVAEASRANRRAAAKREKPAPRPPRSASARSTPRRRCSRPPRFRCGPRR